MPGTVVADNVFEQLNNTKSTEVTLSLRQANTTSWTFDFAPVLLLPGASAIVRSSALTQTAGTTFASTPRLLLAPNNTTITATFAEPLSGTVSVTLAHVTQPF